MSSNPAKYEGSCLCGQVKIQVEGPPIWAAYCHCETCRTWHAAPVNAASMWSLLFILLIHPFFRQFMEGWCLGES